MDKSRRKLRFESLESREMLSVSPLSIPFAPEAALSVQLSGSTLQITGSDKTDWIEVKQAGSQIIVYSYSSYGANQTTLGTYGTSQVTAIAFCGNAGNDTFKNWTSITSTIDGGDGHNLLMGGTGTNIFTNTGIGSNCFVWRGSNDRWAAGSSNDSAGKDDALLLLYDHVADGRKETNYFGGEVYRNWKDSEVQFVLDTVDSVYQRLGNYRYFRNERYDDPSYSYSYQQGAINCAVTDSGLGFVAAFNTGNSIVFNAGNLAREVVIHEVAHNWNNTASNPFYEQFRDISWTDYGYTLKSGASSYDFARDYGKTNANEDWATTLELVLAAPQDFPNTSEKATLKVNLARQFLASIGENSDLVSNSMVVTTADDVVDPNDGKLSLREALLWSSVYVDGDLTITFDAALKGKTITLNGTPLSSYRNITIDAAGMDITIDAAGKSEVFRNDPPTVFSGLGGATTLIGLTLTGASGATALKFSFFWPSILVDVTIVGNTATRALLEGKLAIYNSTIAGNTAPFIAGAYGLTLVNSLIIGNSGRPIQTSGSPGVTIYNSTIVGNGNSMLVGYDVGSSKLDGYLTISNSIIADNGTDNITVISTGTLPKIYNSLISKLYNITPITYLYNIRSDSIYTTTGTAIDPKFVSYTKGTDWKTWDLRLAADSPAIGKGKAALIPEGVFTDFDGNSRTTNGSLDMGAFQSTYVTGTLPAPGNFGTTATVSNLKNDGATITWNAPIGYAIDGGTYSIYLKSDDASQPIWKKTASVATLTTALTGLASDSTYDYKITGKIGGVEVVLAAGTFTTEPRIAAPSELAVTPNTDGTLKLQWADNSNTETGFELQQSADGVTWKTVQTYVANTTTATVAAMQGTTYSFRVRAKATNGDSEWSFSVRFTTPKPFSAPSYVYLSMEYGSVYMFWEQVSGAVNYRVERSLTGNGDWETVYSGSTSTFTDETVEKGTAYYYRVVAVNNEGGTGTSQINSITTPPESLGVRVYLLSEKSVAVQWDAAPGATSYLLERSTDGVKWAKVATVKGKTDYIDKSLKAATKYYYRIAAPYTDYEIPSEPVSVTTPLSSAQVPTLKVDAKLVGVSSVTGLKLTPSKTAPTGLTYYVEYTSSVDAKGKPVWENSVIEKVSGTTHDICTYLTPNKTYFVRTVAIETDYAVETLPAWSEFSSIAIGKETKIKTKSLPAATISTVGFTLNSSYEFGVLLRIKTPQQNDKTTTPLLSSGCTVRYELLIADASAKVDKTTGLLAGSQSLGDTSFTNGMISGKPCADSSMIPFGDLALLDNLSALKTIQFQLVVSYYLPNSVVPFASVPTKVIKLSLPKWLT